jgi:hypothetical protein
MISKFCSQIFIVIKAVANLNDVGVRWQLSEVVSEHAFEMQPVILFDVPWYDLEGMGEFITFSAQFLINQ